jgi:hypothetical protein
MSRPAERVIAFYNKRSTPSIGSRTARVRSSMPDVANAVLLQLHALACDLGNFLRTLARTDPIKVVTDETRRRS